MSNDIKKNLLNLDHNDAKAFFLRPNAYFNNDLPQYFVFEQLLNQTDSLLKSKSLLPQKSNKPNQGSNSYLEDASRIWECNHEILCNKSGRFDWRPIQLIHPVLYVSLVNLMTMQKNWEEILTVFKKFSTLTSIKCESIPVVAKDNKDKKHQILEWWNQIEQSSIKAGLEWEFLFQTDIQNCYSQIYTHAVSWALHGFEDSKTKKQSKSRSKARLGDLIDSHLRAMHFGQTNGIPQGSILMDFISEIVLGKCDEELDDRLSKQRIDEYKILRYRDDYRIFVSNLKVGQEIMKSLSLTLYKYGLKLTSSKTSVSEVVISSSIKRDKIAWLRIQNSVHRLQDRLLLIHDHSLEYQNTGSVTKALVKLFPAIKRATRKKKYVLDAEVLISIVIDIAYRNPKTYPVCSAIVSHLLPKLDEGKQCELIKSIHERFSTLGNTGFFEIWLQRICLKTAHKIDYKEALCRIALGEETERISLWNCDWINDAELKKLVQTEPIFSAQVLHNMDNAIKQEEVDEFEEEKPS